MSRYWQAKRKLAVMKREKQRADVSALYRRHLSSAEIAVRLGIPERLVRRRLCEVRDLLRQQWTEEAECVRAELDWRLKDLYAKAMDAWERSCLESKRSRVRRRKLPGGGDDAAVQAEQEVRSRDGNAQFLQLAESILDRRARLYGVYAPEKVEARVAHVDYLELIRASEGKEPPLVDAQLLEESGGNGEAERES